MIKLTTKKFIDLCNAISDINLSNKSLTSHFAVWCKRLKAKYNDEIDFWNSLTPEEQVLVSDDIIELDMPKLPIVYAPEIYLNSHVEILSTIFTKPLPKRMTKIEQLIQSKKDVKNKKRSTTNKKADSTGN